MRLIIFSLFVLIYDVCFCLEDKNFKKKLEEIE